VNLSRHDLQQLDEAVLQGLPEEVLRRLAVTLLADLKEVQERLGQTPNNSSRPPSSRAPWERGDARPASAAAADASVAAPAAPAVPDVPVAAPREAPVPTVTPAPTARPRRAPGKQPGAPGVGRTEHFRAHSTEEHRPQTCAVCGQPLPGDAPAQAYTAYQTLDVHWGDPGAPGLHLVVTDHRWLEVTCACGHHTRAAPRSGEVAPDLGAVKLREWRLIGPGLATLIVALNLRCRLSRARIRELLGDWFGIHLSIGTLHRTLHETAAVVAPAEPALLAALQASDLLHADETSWPQHAQSRWLWVFISATTVLYLIADRGKATVTRVLAGFDGWLMSDGWFSYRGYSQRLRCWAHLLRKAQGLVECCDPQGSAFGHLVRSTLEDLMAAIYAARDGPPTSLREGQGARLAVLRTAVERHLGHRHSKTSALATEFYNDWDAIFRVLDDPRLPLTNNAAERALRHWVIARQLSHGTRTAVGSRAFALLASVIDTCRQRQHSPWTWLREGITERRAGRPLSPLPAPGG
jgi:transposase